MEKESVHMFVLENGKESVRMETSTQEWRIVCILKMEQKLSVGAVLLFLEQRKEEKCGQECIEDNGDCEEKC